MQPSSQSAPRPPACSSSPCTGARAASSSRARRLERRARGERAPCPFRSSSTATSTSAEDAREALEASGAAGVMIGRGAYGAPWLPGRIAAFLATGRDPAPPSLAEQATHRARARRGDARRTTARSLGLRNARKHIGWYLEQSGRAADTVKAWRRQLCTDDDPGARAARPCRVLRRHAARRRHEQDRHRTALTLPTARRPVEHDLLLTALPHPILVLAEENRIVYANSAAEAFLSTGIALLKRMRLDEVVGVRLSAAGARRPGAHARARPSTSTASRSPGRSFKAPSSSTCTAARCRSSRGSSC